jgi:hypothetical protein
LFLPAVVLLSYAAVAHGQTAPASRIIGEVSAVNGGSNLTIKTDKGEAVSVTLGERTRYLRVMPGETDLKNASKITLADVGAGDRVLALGKLSEDSKTLTATSIIVMTKGDIAKKQEHDQAEWQKRGITGVVTAIAADTKEFTVKVHTTQGEKAVVIESAEKADFRRYAPDSVRFSDAKPSTFAELKVGDHVRALGEKSADGSRMKPEAIVSGTFRPLAGTVISVDAAASEIRVTDLATKKPVVVKVNADTTMKRLPNMLAMGLARRYNPQYFQAMRRGGAGGGAGRSAPGGESAGGPRGGEGGMRAGAPEGGDLQQMLEKVPTLPIAELNKGDAIIISSTVGADPSRLTAITLLAGVEPLLTRAPGERPVNLDWTLDMNGPQ